MSAEKPPRRLGRGLEALLAPRQNLETPTPDERNSVRPVPLGQIRANPYQPRKEFRPEDLADLETSLRATGLLQPITLRRAPDGQGYELIAGERRYRAATRLGWTEIPAIVREVDDRTLLTFALVENLQRADLNPLEEAEGYQRLADEFALTQQQIAEVVGKDRSTVAQALRLLALPASVRRMISTGELTSGHARPLLALGNEHAIVELAREAAGSGLSVRDVERRVREGVGRVPKPRAITTDERPPEVRRIEAHFRQRFGTDVTIHLADAARGEIRLAFFSTDDFQRLVDLLGTPPD